MRGQGARALLVAERRERIAALVREGLTQEQIAEAVSVHPATICRDLRAMRERATVAARTDLSELRDAELARLESIEARAREQFEASKNPAFLGSELRAMQLRVQLLGLDEPQRIAVTSGAEAPADGEQSTHEVMVGVASVMLGAMIYDAGLSLDDAARVLHAFAESILTPAAVAQVVRAWERSNWRDGDDLPAHELRELSPQEVDELTREDSTIGRIAQNIRADLERGSTLDEARVYAARMGLGLDLVDRAVDVLYATGQLMEGELAHAGP